MTPPPPPHGRGTGLTSLKGGRGVPVFVRWFCPLYCVSMHSSHGFSVRKAEEGLEPPLGNSGGDCRWWWFFYVPQKLLRPL